MDLQTIIGLWAAGCTTFALLPQVQKTLRSRKTSDISLPMYLLFTIGIILWLIYGIMLDALPIILANTISLVFSLTILILKLIYK